MCGWLLIIHRPSIVLVFAVFSLSFLPWLLLLLGIVLAVPITAFMDASRRKKEQEALNPPAEDAGEGFDAEDAVHEEVVGEGIVEAEGGFGDGGFGDDAFGGDFGGGSTESAFDDDAFK